MKKRPLGVKIFGMLISIYGVVGLLINLLSMLRMVLAGLTEGPYFFLLVGAIVPMGLVSLVGLITGIGVLMLQNWARWLALMISAAAIAMFLWVTHTSMSGGFGNLANWLGLAIAAGPFGLIIWYFLLPSVKAQFQRSG